jgi:hypothetical protein
MFVEFRNVDPANENSVVSYELKTSFNQPSGGLNARPRRTRVPRGSVPEAFDRVGRVLATAQQTLDEKSEPARTKGPPPGARFRFRSQPARRLSRNS